MINILQVMGCGNTGGISTVVTNYYTHMDRTQYHFDILLTVPDEGVNAKKLRDLGCEIYHTVPKSHNRKQYQADLKALLASGKYQAIHVHENETSYVALRIAKKMGIRCRIAHSHTSSPTGSWKAELKRLSGVVFNYHYATQLLACGQLAGDRVFGKRHMKSGKATVLPNAIELDRFSYSPEDRAAVRKELHLENAFVAGMVGRLAPEKNIPFALHVFRALVKTRPEAVLLLVGDGEERVKLEQLIQEYQLNDHVRLLGRRTDVQRLYSAMDVLLMPSIHEGFPMVVVEASASGLPILLSDTVTKEFSWFENVKYHSLESIYPWLDSLNNRHYYSKRIFISLIQKYEITCNVLLLECKYHS